MSVIALALLTGCAEKRLSTYIPGSSSDKAKGYYKVGKPYKIRGRWYHPKEDFNYNKVGVASWYGPNFHGKRTANGEVFNKHDMTAAHKTLPLPSMVRVTNLVNGRSVKLRVNDRGPFAQDRIIDVSYAAAKKLGFVENGVAKVRVEILPEESHRLAVASGRKGNAPKSSVLLADAGNEVMTPVEAADGLVAETSGDRKRGEIGIAHAKPEDLFLPLRKRKAEYRTVSGGARQHEVSYSEKSSAFSLPVRKGYYVQAGAFTSHVNADRVRAQLATSGDNPEISSIYQNGVKLHRVRIGPIASAETANRKLRSVLGDGFNEARIVID